MRSKKTCGQCRLYEKGGWCWIKEDKVKKQDKACRDYPMVNG